MAPTLPCRFGNGCRFKATCTFAHLDQPCPVGKGCKQFSCELDHPNGRTPKCRNGEACHTPNCWALHPNRDGNHAPTTPRQANVPAAARPTTPRQTNVPAASRPTTPRQANIPTAPKPTTPRQSNAYNRPASSEKPQNKFMPKKEPSTVPQPFSLDDDDSDEDLEESFTRTLRIHGQEEEEEEDEEYLGPPACFRGGDCAKRECKFVHPASRVLCEAWGDCQDTECTAVHPQARKKPCRNKMKCGYLNCFFKHPAGWSPCPEGKMCVNLTCPFPHPPTRTQVCGSGLACRDSECGRLHPDDWDPNGITQESQRVRNLKSFDQRQQERIEAGLPILQCREEFLRRLKREKVLVVTAATGSGKTTQLPQYAAESDEFDQTKLIVCTQPRAIAARTISQRIGEEFDGTGVGDNVGFKAGGSKSTAGKRIMLMTDSALISEAQKDPKLSKISVLIIDEAHERSLNTDIVLGIAKLVLAQRPNDFYVVIASATIDPKPFFCFFFDLSEHDPSISGYDDDFASVQAPSPFARQFKYHPLKVPGRLYPVTIENVDVKDKKVKDVLIPKLVEVLEHQTRGHCLVFLQGSGEVEKAIKDFQTVAKPNWNALPLYGPLPPEEQQKVMKFNDENGTQRMIVFCTNVAETSLTVPGVRIVVDVGLAKEARYDPKRRMTVLEEVLISQSSADQRKGRAGRTSEGYCLRLYSPDDITRSSIEPEILRSSLDLVILQLACLGHNPRSFPFISKPPQENIDGSITVLQRLECLDRNMRVTPRGEMFNQMPFDPRTSFFIANCFEKYGHGQCALEIASIMSAPGSIFFMGGKDKKTKDENKLRRAAAAVEGGSNSDLLYMRSVYNEWKKVGATDSFSKTCPQCKAVSKQGNCRKCQIKYTMENSLNSKVLNIVASTVDEVMRTLKQRRMSQVAVDCVEAEAVGRALSLAYEEQLAEFLAPNDPKAGVHIMDSGMQASVANTSALSRGPPKGKKLIIVMNISQTPTGRIFADSLHSLDHSWLTSRLQELVRKKSIDMKRCFSQENLNFRFQRSLAKHFQELVATRTSHAREYGLIVTHHSQSTMTLSVFAPAVIAKEVAKISQDHIEALMQEELDYEADRIVGRGCAVARFTSGFVLDSLEDVGFGSRIRMESLDNHIKTPELLEKWVCNLSGIKPNDIKYSSLKDGVGIVVFKSPGIADKVKNKIQADPRHAACLSFSTSAKETLGRMVLWRVAGQVPPIPDSFKNRLSCKRLGKEQAPEISLKLDGLHATVSIPLILSSLGSPKCTIEPLKPARGQDSVWTVVKFNNMDEYNRAVSQFPQSYLARTAHCISGTNKAGKSYTGKSILPRMSAFTPKERPNTYSVICNSPTDADNFCRFIEQSGSGQMGVARGESLVEIERSHLLELTTILANIESRFNCKTEIQRIDNTNKKYQNRQGSASTCRVKISGQEPSRCGAAAQLLMSCTSPIKWIPHDVTVKAMLQELVDIGFIKQRAGRLEITQLIDKREKTVYGLTVYGSGQEQGRFMGEIRNYIDKFNARFRLVKVDPALTNQFRFKDSLGLAAMDEIEGKMNETVSITYSFIVKSLQLLVSPRFASSAEKILKKCEELIYQDFFVPFGGKKVDDNSKCVYCHSASGTPFRICGHRHCDNCFVSSTKEAAEAGQFPISCPSCRTPVHIIDLRNALGDNFEKVAESATRSFISQNPDSQHMMCPSGKCGAIVSRNGSYGRCISCGDEYCPKCLTVNDALHLNLSCVEYKAAIGYCKNFPKEKLFQEAREWAHSNWAPDMPKIVGIYDNPGVLNGCMAMQRFCGGLNAVYPGILPERLFQLSMFTWHGSSEEGVASICSEGFSPQFRSGQAYGPGEYFGFSSSVSRGFCKNNSSHMIVGMILNKIPEFSSHSTYCYVVNNPIDFKISYCLPVSVVNFGTMRVPNFKLQPTVLLPYPWNLIFQRSGQAGLDDEEEGGKVGWVSPFRWRWQTDKGAMECYTDTINALMETYFAQFLSKRIVEFHTPAIVRYLDDKPQEYSINFHTMRQRNLKTGYERVVSRERVKILDIPGVCWQVELFPGKWSRFELAIHGTIESYYRQFLSGGQSIVKVRFPGRPEEYEINFAIGTQTNLTTNRSRSLRRSAEVEDVTTLDDEMVVIKVPKSVRSESAIHLLQNQKRQHRLKQTLSAMTDRFTHPIAGNIAPVLHVDAQSGAVTLTLTGAAKAACPLLVGAVLNECDADAWGLSAIKTSGEAGQAMMRNPRLLQLALNDPPAINPRDRNDVTLLLAHTATWKAKLMLCGSFICDWAINQTSSRIQTLIVGSEGAGDSDDEDFDAEEESAGSYARALALFRGIATKFGFQVSDLYSERSIHTLSFKGPWAGAPIDVDIMEREFIAPDSDVNNIGFFRGTLRKRAAEVGRDNSLQSSLLHCQQKQFVFYPVPNATGFSEDNQNCLIRLYQKGFIWQTPHPILIGRESFPQYQRQLLVSSKQRTEQLDTRNKWAVWADKEDLLLLRLRREFQTAQFVKSGHALLVTANAFDWERIPTFLQKIEREEHPDLLSF